jgi:hypothetical protein
MASAKIIIMDLCNNPIKTSIWLLFLRVFLHQVLAALRDSALEYGGNRWFQFYDILENFLSHGSDRDIIIVAFQNSLHVPSHDFRAYPDEADLYYIELRELLPVINPPPPNMIQISRLLISDHRHPFWTNNTRSLARWLLPEAISIPKNIPSVSARRRYRAASVDEILVGKWSIWGLASETEEWYGGFTIRLY